MSKKSISLGAAELAVKKITDASYSAIKDKNIKLENMTKERDRLARELIKVNKEMAKRREDPIIMGGTEDGKGFLKLLEDNLNMLVAEAAKEVDKSTLTKEEILELNHLLK